MGLYGIYEIQITCAKLREALYINISDYYYFLQGNMSEILKYDGFQFLLFS